MAEACPCRTLTLGNMGIPNCTPIALVAKTLILVPYYKADGTVNSITLSDTLDADYFNDRINQYDTSDVRVNLQSRWYITPPLQNVDEPKADTIYEEFDSGEKAKVRDGVRSFTGLIVKGAAYPMLKKVKKFQCSVIGAFVIDAKGNLIGNGSESGKLRPIAINKETFNPQYVKPTASTVAKINLMFDWGTLEFDDDLAMITTDDMEVNPLDLLGSIDVYATISGISTTGFTALLKTSYGSAKNPLTVKGLVAGDFTIHNVTDNLPVVIVSCTESTTVPGTYAFTFAAQTSADVLRLTIIKNGLDGTEVEATTITIP